mgnify:FL=1
MRRVSALATAIIVAIGLLAAAPTANSVQPAAKFKNCKQLLKKYPNGVARQASITNPGVWADSAERRGYLRPRVISERKFDRLKPTKRFRTKKTDPRYLGDYFFCGQKKPRQVPPTPANLGVSSPRLVLDDSFPLVFQEAAGVYPPPVYDVYINGELNKTVTFRPSPSSGVHTFYPTVTGLQPATSYQVYVIARNDVGSSPPTPTVTITTAPAPKTTYTLEYTAGCASGDCSALVTNATGGTDRIDPTGNRTWTFEIPKTSYKIYSILVSDNTYSNSTSCQIKVDGRVVESASSSGGSSAYCGYITR